MKNRQSSAQHSQKIRQKMNSEKFGLSKFPRIKNNKLISGRSIQKSRPFSCLPGSRITMTSKDCILDRIPSTKIQRKIKLMKHPMGMEHIIHGNTVIRQTIPLNKNRKIDLDVDTPIDFMLYNKNDPVLRDIFNGIKRKKKNKRQSLFKIKKKEFLIKRKKSKISVNSRQSNQKIYKPFILHRKEKKENLKNNQIQKFKTKKRKFSNTNLQEEQDDSKKEELFNRDEMTRCALKYLPPEMKISRNDEFQKTETNSFENIFTCIDKELNLINNTKIVESLKDIEISQTLMNENMLFKSKINSKSDKNKKETRIEKDVSKFVYKKLDNLKNKNNMGEKEQNKMRQQLAISKMKQRQNEEEEFKSPSERIGRYMQFSSVLQKEHLLEVLDLIKGVSKKEKKEGEIPIQLVCWNERIGLNRVQRVGAAYYEDIETLIKRNCFMLYPEFLDSTLKTILINKKIIKKTDFRDRLRPTEEYYKWILQKCRNTYDPIFLSELAIDPPSLETLPISVKRMILTSTINYNELWGDNSPISPKELSPFRKSWIENVLEKIDSYYVQYYNQDFKKLWKEIFDEYILIGKKIIVDYALRYHRERRKWRIQLLKRPNLSFSQKIFESGGYHRQFHDRWHRFFENSKRFMTKEFFGINGLSLTLHQWFQNFDHFSLSELKLTSSLGFLNKTLSPKEFFLFQEFHKKMIFGFINQILIRGAYFLIKKKKLFCRKELKKLKWTLDGCGDFYLSNKKLNLNEIKFLQNNLKKNKKEKSEFENVINILRLLLNFDKNNSNTVSFQELLLNTKLKDLQRINMENPKIDLNSTKFGFPEETSNWNNNLFIREDFKMKILYGIKKEQTKEEIIAEEKLEKTLGTLMGLKLRKILAKSIEDILEFFESFKNKQQKIKNSLYGINNPKILKKIETETYTPIFKIDLVVDNGVLKLGEIEKKLIEELNSFFLGLCQSFKNILKPKFIKIDFVKNAFEKNIKSNIENDDKQSKNIEMDTVLGKLNLFIYLIN